MKLYMAVTADEFELPIAVEVNRKALAEKTGYKVNTISSMISRGVASKKNNIKFIKLEVKI